MKISAISSVNYAPKMTNTIKPSKYQQNPIPQNKNVSFKDGQTAAVVGTACAIIGAFILGPLGALIGGAVGAGAGAATSTDGELTDYERERITHYD